MTRLLILAAVTVAAAGCNPLSMSTMFVVPGDAPVPAELTKTTIKPEVRYRPPVQVSQLNAENAKAKAAELNDELDRDLMELVETRDAKKKE